MRVAPLGAFGAMSFTIGRYGIGALAQLGFLMLCFYLTCVLFVFVVMNLVLRMTGLRLWPLLRYIKEEFFIVLGTSSSEAALPSLMVKLERLGCNKPLVGLVVPLGYAFNLDGTSIYFTMAITFIAQALNIPLTWGDYLVILTVLLLTSKGAAAVTGGGFITLAATLATLNGKVPVAGIVLVLAIDRFMSEARAITNLFGNSVATVVVAWWEGQLDLDRARRVLAGQDVPELEGAEPGIQVT
jgi:aerobic C4-dicarboxylate transport protein